MVPIGKSSPKKPWLTDGPSRIDGDGPPIRLMADSEEGWAEVLRDGAWVPTAMSLQTFSKSGVLLSDEEAATLPA